MNELPRLKLCELIAKYGEWICDEPLRLEGLLRDLCPQNRREINVLINALKERVATDLRNSSATIPVEVLLAQLIKRLEDQQALTQEMARWAVESWALALGKISEYDLRQQPVSSTPFLQPRAPAFSPRQSAQLERPGAGEKVRSSLGSQLGATQTSSETVTERRLRKLTWALVVSVAILVAGIAALWYFAVFLPQRTATQSATPQPATSERTAQSTVAPTPVLTETPTATLTMTPIALLAPTAAATATPMAALVTNDEAQAFINEFYRTLEGNNPNEILRYYDDSVDFLQYGRRDKVFIADDYRKYFEASPIRSYSIGDINLENSPTQNTATASFDIHYSVQNPRHGKVRSGRAHQQWVLAKPGGLLKIIRIDETVYPDSSATSAPSTGDEEAVRDFIRSYYAALSQHSLGTVVSMFAESAYYDGKQRGKQYIAGDVASYLKKYDTLDFNIQQPIDVSQTGSREFSASFSFTYNVRNRRGDSRHGVSSNRWTLQVDTAGNIQITSQRETVHRGK